MIERLLVLVSIVEAGVAAVGVLALFARAVTTSVQTRHTVRPTRNARRLVRTVVLDDSPLDAAVAALRDLRRDRRRAVLATGPPPRAWPKR